MQITVNVDQVDLSSVIGTRHELAGYEGEYSERPVTLADAIADRAVQDLRADDAYQTLRKRVLDLRDEEIRAQLKPIIAEAIAQPVQRTNGYGNPVGDPVSLTELIIAQTRAVLDHRDSYDRSQTFVGKLIRDEVTRALTKELTEVIAAEKTKVVAAVRAQAATLIADSIKQGLRA